MSTARERALERALEAYETPNTVVRAALDAFDAARDAPSGEPLRFEDARVALAEHAIDARRRMSRAAAPIDAARAVERECKSSRAGDVDANALNPVVRCPRCSRTLAAKRVAWHLERCVRAT